MKNLVKNHKYLQEKCIEKNLLNLIFTEKSDINKIIQNNSNKPIEKNPDLSEFDIDICHLCDKNINDIPVKNHCHYPSKILGYAHNECSLRYKFKKDNTNV